MLPLDVARCVGKLTKVRNKPLPCCVLCERRVWPAGERIVFHDFTPVHKMTEWVCDGHIPYTSGVAGAALQPAGPAMGRRVLFEVKRWKERAGYRCAKCRAELVGMRSLFGRSSKKLRWRTGEGSNVDGASAADES